MGNPVVVDLVGVLRMLPSTDELATSPAAQAMLAEVGQKRLTALCRTAIELVRKEIANSPSALSRETVTADAASRLKELWASQQQARLRKVINATGVVIHTNLGRAPLSAAAIQAIQAAGSYCTLEYDLKSGKRGKRGCHVERLISEITGAESALVVNNCAAAAFLVLSVFAAGGEVPVSRGELVEIGGDFRIPDVLTQSGAFLKEVGTTNRTKLSDYERAFSEKTKLVLRVHPSNYRIVGFTGKPTLAELAELTRRRQILLYEDAGSGALLNLAGFGLDEPSISRSIADGADLVTFSGDKLLGGAQAGVIVGRKSLIDQMRKHPLYRALRVSKLIYAALGATLESYLREDAQDTIPVLRMLGFTKEDIRERAQNIITQLGNGPGCDIEIIPGESVIGGGSAPDVRRETYLLALSGPKRSASVIEERLRLGETPVIGRIENDRILLDLRTVHESEEAELIRMLITALG